MEISRHRIRIEISCAKYVLRSRSLIPPSRRLRKIDWPPKTLSAFYPNLPEMEDKANVIVDCAAVPALVRYLQTPPTREGDIDPTEYEVEKGSAFTLGLLAIKPEHQQHIVDHSALPHLVNLLKRHKDGLNSQAVCGVIRRAADAITNLAHENSSIKTFVRVDGGIPPLVELLEFADTKVQRSAAGALRTLAFKNDENKNQVGVIGNLVHSSPNIKREVLAAGALQPVIALLRDNVADLIRVGGVQKLQDGEFIVQVKPFPTNKKYACGAITAALFLKQVKKSIWGCDCVCLCKYVR
ncbi:hypothetical protein CASFOL_004450 [Castilleja foliolosa]|uniref:Uncharacterized protein n=1 Tax=Castilleja foliolosa TaxID=1961234 RepID=A0ABD3EAH3_9LAMI